MVNRIDKAITFSFFALFLLVPLVVIPYTSELFEFNKMVLTYAAAVIILFLWVAKMIVSKKIVFKKTILDIPLLIFLGSQLLSTVFSIDQRTSLFGFYSRFHGGLLSQISYALLYWSYVSNMDPKKTAKAIKILFASGLVVSIWGILEHFGHSFSCLIFPDFKSFDVSCWVQDVQNRVFATLGQPNWLAAWIVALTPLTFVAFLDSKFKILNTKIKKVNFLLAPALSSTFLLVLLYTGSRSGFLAFAVASFIFWTTTAFLTYKKHQGLKNDFIKKFVICNLSLVILALTSGTPWSPSLSQILQRRESPSPTYQLPSTNQGPALEVGGTESGKIRQIVWQGSLDIWKNFPILGTGVETFGFSYYQFKPREHNLTSEWDFLYNKAHNEYLNFAATTGSVGLLTYLALTAFSLYQIIKYSKLPSFQASKQVKNKKIDFGDLDFLRFGFFAGYASILVTNFFGFSVVPVAILFFLFPAFAVTLSQKPEASKDIEKLSGLQIFGLATILLATCYLLLTIARYWYADYLYAKGKIENRSGNPHAAQEFLVQATSFSPKEAVYWDELSDSATILAVSFFQNGNRDASLEAADKAINTSDKAINLSPANVNLKRNRASMFVRLSIIDPQYLNLARQTLDEAVKKAPTDPRLFYNLSLTYLRTGDDPKAIEIMQKAVELKPNYKEARYALAQMYYDEGEIEKAVSELTFILENIDPDDEASRRELNEIIQ